MLDTAIVNGRVHTMGADGRVAEAVGIKFGRIAMVGDGEEIRRWCGPRTEVIDAMGKTVLPGFIDSHMHPFIAASFFSGLNLSKARSIEELKALVASGKGGTVMGYGWNMRWLKEGRFPTRWDLDEVAPDRAVYLIDYSGHTCLVNSEYILRRGIDSTTPDPVGGEIVRDSSGEPTGLMRETACEHLSDPAFMITWGGSLSYEEMLRRGEEILHMAPVNGLTTITDAIVVKETIKAYQQLEAEGRLRVRVNMMVWHKLLDELESLGLRSGFGGEFLKMAGVKVLQDGSMSGHTAALEEPYDNEPGTRGVTYLSQSELDGTVRRAHEAGFRVFVHAIGDRAMRMTLDALEGVVDDGNRLRHRMEHCLLWNEELIARCSEMGVIANVPPVFMMRGQYWMVDCVGERQCLAYPWRSLLDAGIRLCFHTDFMVEPMNPLMNIYAAVTRKDADGKPEGGYHPEQRLTVEEAVRAVTIDAAYAACEEEVKGSIEVGKMADLVIISGNLFEVPPDDIKDIQVERTVLGGKTVYAL